MKKGGFVASLFRWMPLRIGDCRQVFKVLDIQRVVPLLLLMSRPIFAAQ